MVGEEILRTVGNLARYSLAANSAPQTLAHLLAPLLDPTLHATARGPLACRAAQRVLAEAPPELARSSNELLPVLHAVLRLFSSQQAASASQQLEMRPALPDDPAPSALPVPPTAQAAAPTQTRSVA